ncbi:response regulator transcription factor [Gordonia sp. FQ]|uniref:response regulator transcription factor n=1 Tax=Gordonia sp. FQ TaxID=3446634 RepID=UPI003F851600
MVVEDDATVRGAVGDYLRAHRFRVVEIADGAAARTALRQRIPDVVVLDRMLPRVSGDELCRQIRDTLPQVGVIMLTALGAAPERIRGLEQGADDYLTKPFAMRELHLRIDTLLRRTRARTDVGLLEAGPFRVDPAHRIAYRGGVRIDLTTREYELLAFFVQNPGRVCGRDEIMAEVWGWSFGDASTVTVHVRRLREKIEAEPRYPRHLLTEWGAGYRFVADDEPGESGGNRGC